MLRLLIVLAAATLATAADDVILKPPSTPESATAAAIVMMQGAGIGAAQYEDTMVALQTELATNHNIALWVAVPQYLGSIVEPAVIGFGVKRVLKALTAAGKPDSAALFFGGHSLGGAMLELYAHDNAEKLGALGAIFMGSFVARNRRDAATGLPSYPIPTLTLAGELDGLSRVTRNGAEAYYQQISKAADAADAKLNAAVVVLPGVAHMQFASGDLPLLVKERDLLPEVSYDDAHADVAAVAANFIAALAAGSAGAKSALSARVDATGEFLGPLIEAFRLEGSAHFNPSCDSDFPTNPSCEYPIYPGKALIPGTYPNPPKVPAPADCTCGSEWVSKSAEPIMSGWAVSPDSSSGAHAVSRDAFHSVSDVAPFHLPHIFNYCSSPDGCVLNSTTLTMPVFETLDKYADTGFASISASELRTKLKSRESMWQRAKFDDADIDFDATDAKASTCQQINQAAYDWALKSVGAAAAARFAKVGEPYVMVADTDSPIGITGPTWIKNALAFNQVQNPAAALDAVVKTHVEVAAPFFAIKNKNDGNGTYLIPVGYHYCKLLSPARAMEWIMVDGLRSYASVKARAEAEAVAPTKAEAAANPTADEVGGRCCEACDVEGEVKYHSVDEPHHHCGECCMKPSQYKLFKIFEWNLTLSEGNTPCQDLGWPAYDTTVSHGVWPVKMTLDLFNREEEEEEAAVVGGEELEAM